MASMASMIRCSAESVPMVMSVPQKSLSIDPTMPAMWSTPNLTRCSSVMRLVFSNSSSKSLHSWRNKLAPVNEPSPPITTYLKRWVMSANGILLRNYMRGEGMATHQIGDSTIDEIFRGRQTSFKCAKCGTTSRSNYSAATVDDTRHGRPICFDNVVAAIDHALVALTNEIYLRKMEELNEETHSTLDYICMNSISVVVGLKKFFLLKMGVNDAIELFKLTSNCKLRTINLIQSRVYGPIRAAGRINWMNGNIERGTHTCCVASISRDRVVHCRFVLFVRRNGKPSPEVNAEQVLSSIQWCIGYDARNHDLDLCTRRVQY